MKNAYLFMTLGFMFGLFIVVLFVNAFTGDFDNRGYFAFVWIIMIFFNVIDAALKNSISNVASKVFVNVGLIFGLFIPYFSSDNNITYVYFGIAMVILYNVLLFVVAKLSGISDCFHNAFVKLQKNENINITKEAHPGKSLTLL